jgi:hypothetical protein
MDALGPQAAAAQRDAAALALVAAHKSTAERLPALDEFHRQLFAHVACPATVLDVGCGLYPLVFPFDGAASGVTRYVAVDRDPKAAAAVAAYARARGDGRVVAERWELQTGWDEVLGRSGLDGFDLALVLKMVPVIARQQRSLLTVLARTPATRWIVSGSRVSMTRRRSIERRERAVLHKFVASAGRRVEAEFVAGEEFAFVVV